MGFVTFSGRFDVSLSYKQMRKNGKAPTPYVHGGVGCKVLSTYHITVSFEPIVQTVVAFGLVTFGAQTSLSNRELKTTGMAEEADMAMAKEKRNATGDLKIIISP